MSEPFDARGVVGPAVLIGNALQDEDGVRVSRGVMMESGSPRLCTVRELSGARWEDTDDFAYRARMLHHRSRLLRSLDGAGSPRLLAANAGQGGVVTSIEEPAGAVSLVELLATIPAGTAPPGLAVLVVRQLAAMWERAAQFQVSHPAVTREEVFVTWDGRVQATHEQLINERQVMAAGAMVAIVPQRVGYRAPEQVRGLPLTDSVGVFNCGLFLFEVLTGRDAFEGASGFELISRIVQARVLSLRQTRSGLLSSLYEFFETCTRLEADERYLAWGEFRGALDAVASGLEPFTEGDLAALLERQFPKARAAAAVLEDLAATFDVNGARKRFQLSPFDPMVIAPFAPRGSPSAARGAVPSEPMTWVGSDSRPMLRAGSLFVDRRPVTNAEYARFVTETGRPSPSHWQGRATPPFELEESPVTFVTQVDAVAYAAWAGKRLPEDHEWGLALQHLGAERLGSGAIWEWTASARQSGYVVRGGVWRDRPDLFDAASNSWESRASKDVGFRCVRDA
ncbi:MAG: SUMF1/EgtB/PvdO family nonheme iron enzyme [Archangium sp.]